jgi:DNA-binding response OmpR family regulator
MRILLVDDDINLTELLKLVFESRGFGVTIADSGEETLEILQNELPEAILLDLMMPGISGLEVCKRIRSDPRTSNIPVIVLTAKTGPESRTELMEAGATDYLVKPIMPNDLINRIQEIVTRSTSPTANVLT